MSSPGNMLAIMVMTASLIVLRLLRVKNLISSKSASLVWAFVASLGFISLIMFGAGTAQQKALGSAAMLIVFALYHVSERKPRDGSRSP